MSNGSVIDTLTQVVANIICQLINHQQTFAATMVAGIKYNTGKLYCSNIFSSMIMKQIVGIQACCLFVMIYILRRQSHFCRSSKAMGELKE